MNLHCKEKKEKGEIYKRTIHHVDGRSIKGKKNNKKIVEWKSIMTLVFCSCFVQLNLFLAS